MKNLQTLAAITGAATILSIGYAVFANDPDAEIVIDSDDGQSMRHTVIGERSEFVSRNNDRVLEAKWRGRFALTDDGNSIASLDHTIEIELDTDNEQKRVIFKNKNGNIKKVYYVDNDEQPENAKADKAISDLFLLFLRMSGQQADERVSALLKLNGAKSVLDEIDYLKSDHALRRYSVALAEQVILSTEQIILLTKKLATMESDHDLRLALNAILEYKTISAEVMPVLISAADNIKSDHDLRLVIEALAKHSLNDKSMDLVIGLFERIESDHDLRVAAQTLLENSNLDTHQAAKLLQAAAHLVESDHDMRLILVSMAPMFFNEELLADAWIAGFQSLEASHDQRLSLIAATENGEQGNTAWLALITACEDIDSGHDRRLALQAIADEMGGAPELIAAYRTVAAMITSNSDRRRAFEAIGDKNDD